ncbi:thiamine pyrophosphate-binding protein [Gimesia aquarii]|uniref:pyruvate decarboxylase n=1 Tax=Gimesia aquarii TaxID=2527964 RepID=A0A517VQY1_9PLAN|nr:thiamine pyrophosphate-binding protein [Gimesia aquarii]QDT95434.1 Pyruvate decarboxylase [Gimesia aquarii]
MSDHCTTTVGSYLASRLEEIGLQHYFAVPGDYNLVLLDKLLENKNMQMISCCNELNAGYAADGYARATGGASAVFVTYSVGGLSLLNAIAGAYAEDLPVIAVSGGPNTNSESEFEMLHHTLGTLDYDYQRDIFSKVTAEAVTIHDPREAPAQIDHAIQTALRFRKPVYIEIACNIASAVTAEPTVREFGGPTASDPLSLNAAVEHAAELLNSAVKPVMVAGVKLRSFGAEEHFHKLADASGYAIATMPNAKGFFDEQHANYIGIYWGPVGSPGCGEIVDSADLCLFAGPTFTDYTTTGHAALINPTQVIQALPNSVVFPDRTFSNVKLADFLESLSTKLNPNDASMVAYKRIQEEVTPLRPGAPETALSTRQLFSRIQQMLGPDSAVIAETGDSWFNGIQLDLPTGSRFEVQMQYGSIGWSVGATLGYSIGAPNQRPIALIGDGSFQLTAQEVSTIIRYGLKPIIFLINNGGYTIEVEIHDGPYNTIKNWNYAELVKVFNAEDGNGWSCKAGTEGELDEAIQKAVAHNGPAFIEVLIDRDDCSKNLLVWGGHVAKNNGRPPHSA